MIKRNIKMIVTLEESKQVQEICFANGIFWSGKDFTVILLDKEYLMIRDGITWDDKKRFCELNLEEVDAKFFIKTKGTCIEENPEQELNKNIEEEQMRDNEVETYKDVKEYLVAKGLYERVLELEWDDAPYTEFSDLFIWDYVVEGYDFWDDLDDNLHKLDIKNNIESLVQDYKATQGGETYEDNREKVEKYVISALNEVEETPKQPTNIKPKQYLCYVSGKALPKHIHKTLEQAKQEAKRLCRKELCEVMVLEVVSKYQAKVIVEEV